MKILLCPDFEVVQFTAIPIGGSKFLFFFSYISIPIKSMNLSHMKLMPNESLNDKSGIAIVSMEIKLVSFILR